MAPKVESYRLLNEDSGASNEELTGHEYLSRRDDIGMYRFSKRTLLIVGSLLTASVSTNTLLAFSFWSSRGHDYNSVCKTATIGLEDNMPTVWPDQTPFTVSNITEADRAWSNVDIDHGLLALDKKWAKDQGLPDSVDYPWDPTYSTYMMTSVHSIHCLKTLHRSNLEYRHNVPQTYETEHLLHCLDNIRQDIVCAADDTPRYIPIASNGKDPLPIGAGQTRQCKDWSKMERWSREHSACFSYNEELTHELKHEAKYPHAIQFCAKDSKFLPAIRKFYNKPDDWVPEKPKSPYPPVGIE